MFNKTKFLILFSLGYFFSPVVCSNNESLMGLLSINNDEVKVTFCTMGKKAAIAFNERVYKFCTKKEKIPENITISAPAITTPKKIMMNVFIKDIKFTVCLALKAAELRKNCPTPIILKIMEYVFYDKSNKNDNSLILIHPEFKGLKDMRYKDEVENIEKTLKTSLFKVTPHLFSLENDYKVANILCSVQKI